MTQLAADKIDQRVAQIRSQFDDAPLIAIIGATSPGWGYELDMGFMTGFECRRAAESHNAWVFTGGVSGVGLDAYAGVLRYETDKSASHRFFMLIPNQFGFKDQTGAVRFYPYSPPTEYNLLARLVDGGSPKKVRAGQDMSERRRYLASVADVAVMVNGSGGTLDEAFALLRHDKTVVAVKGTGGAADDLLDAKANGQIDRRWPIKIEQLSRLQSVHVDHINAKGDQGEICDAIDKALLRRA